MQGITNHDIEHYGIYFCRCDRVHFLARSVGMELRHKIIPVGCRCSVCYRDSTGCGWRGGCICMCASSLQQFGDVMLQRLTRLKKAQPPTGGLQHDANEIDPDSIRGAGRGSTFKGREGEKGGVGVFSWSLQCSLSFPHFVFLVTLEAHLPVLHVASKRDCILTLPPPLTDLQGFEFITHTLVWLAANAAQPFSGPALTKVL